MLVKKRILDIGLILCCVVIIIIGRENGWTTSTIVIISGVLCIGGALFLRKLRKTYENNDNCKMS
jgi:hypothetical protein